MPKKKDNEKVILQPKLKKEDETNELDRLSVGEVSLGLGDNEPEVEILTDSEDLDKKNYIKISSTFFVKPVELEDGVEKGEDDEEFYKVLNPETGVAEKRTLTEDEKHQIVVKELKEQHIKFRNVTHDGNVTHVKFNASYKKNRNRKNRQTRKSRQKNRVK